MFADRRNLTRVSTSVLVLAILLGIPGCGRRKTTPTSGAKDGGSGASAQAGTPGGRPMAAVGEPSLGAPGVPAAGGTTKLTNAQADALMGASIAEFAKPNRNCKAILQTVFGAISSVEQPTDKTRGALYAAARCAEVTKNYRAALTAGSLLGKVDPSSTRHAFVPRAYMGLGRTTDAETSLVAINKAYPNEPEVLFTAATLARHEKIWPGVIKITDATIKAVHASKDPEVKSFGWRSAVLKTEGHMMSGDLAGADRAITLTRAEGAPAPYVESLQKELVPMKATKIGVVPNMPDSIYLGTYHLFGHAPKGDLFALTVVNFTPKDTVLKVEMEIPGITDKVTKSVTVLKGKHEDLHITPPLKADFKPSAQGSERAASVHVKVTNDADKVVFEETYPTTIMPRDQLPMGLQGLDIIPAWVTPQAGIVEEFMTAAKQRHPTKSLAGSYSPTMPQVKAIYEELKARGMSYVLVTDFGAGTAQHVRLPADTIKSTNALCIDGAVLFATLFEKIGLKPIVVLIPGHAFVGWHAESADKQSPGANFYLETTMVGTDSFENAVSVATDEVAKEKKRGHFENHASTLIDVLEMRQKGISAQPWD